MKSISIILVLLVGASFVSQAQQARKEAKLKPTDKFQLRISGVPATDVASISGTYDVAEDGKFPLPYVGRITAANLTPSQLGIRIEQAYKTAEIFTKPTIIVTRPEATASDGLKITVGGEVKAPNRVVFQNGMTLLEAVITVGGPTDWGDMKRVRLIRAGKTSEHDLRRVSENPKLDVQLKPEDKIIVPHR